jgi:predicted metalloprotease
LDSPLLHDFFQAEIFLAGNYLFYDGYSGSSRFILGYQTSCIARVRTGLFYWQNKLLLENISDAKVTAGLKHMAYWDKIGSRGNVEDRRGMRTLATAGGGIGLVGLILTLLLNYYGGGDLSDVLNQIENVPLQTQNYNTADFEGADNYEVFVSTVLGSNNDMWTKIFARNNLTYTPPKLVLFRQLTQSACGTASSQVGPHYCPLDETIYIDETFFDELQARFKAQGGDVAEAYVISHEVGHHVQNELNVMDEVQAEQQANSEQAEELSIKLELQADCFAGLWANSVKDLGVFEEGEIKEALDAAAAVGDDRIQATITGRVDPESWTHGSSEQRMSWFNKGFETGSVAECNTFI